MTPSLTRRTLLRLAGATAAGAVVVGTSACTGDDRSTPPPSGGTDGPSTTVRSTGPTGPTTPSRDRTPSAADWAALRRSLEGGLTRPGQAAFAAAHRIFDPRWDPVAPAAVARVHSTADVGHCLAFARRFGLAPTPRGGGHSYLGASTARGSLVLDLRSMNRVAYDPTTRTARVGGGADLLSTYRTLAGHGRSVAGGTCPSVGLAGLMMGGGFGIFDRRHGLTCDAVTGLELVVADGSVRTVSAGRDGDLFWALRGGGPGDLGVLTQVRTATFATAPVGRWFARWAWTDAMAVVAGWQRFVQDASPRTWVNLHLDHLADGSRSVVLVGFSTAGSESSDLEACRREVGARPALTSHSVHSHLDTVLSLAGDGGRESFVAGSSVPSRWLGSDGVRALVSAVADGGHWSGERHAICDPLGGAAGAADPSGSAFPWRSSPFTVQWYAKLSVPSAPSAPAQAASWVARSRRALGRWAPGAYVGYPSADVVDPATYLGGSGARLRSVKASVDPSGLFRPPTGTAG